MKCCSHCKIVLTAENGYLRKSGELKNLCRWCGRNSAKIWHAANTPKAAAARKDWASRNRNKTRESSFKYHRRFKELINALKGERPCYDCGGIFPPEVMDFDHVRGTKLFGVATVQSLARWDDIRREIDKCDLVCANCHRVRTQKRLCQSNPKIST